MSRQLRWLSVLPLLAFSVVVAAQSFPLTNLLGYEYATLCGVLTIWVGVPRLIGRRERWWDEEHVWRSWFRAVLPLAAALTLAGALSAANALRVQNCDLVAGVSLFLVLALGAVPTAAMLALVSVAARPGRAAFGVALAVVAASYAGTLTFLATQPPITAYNPYFGYFAGSIYDEALGETGSHLWFRLYTLAAAVAATALVALRRSRRGSDVAMLCVAAATAVTVFAHRGALGIERSRDHIVAELGGRIETPHFEIYFDDGAFTPRARSLLASDHEARFEGIRRRLGVQAPARKMRSFVYANREQKGALMGARNTLFAKIWLGEMQILWDGLGDGMLAHELTHLMLAGSAGGSGGLPTRFGLPLNGVLEGAANAVEWSAEELDDHAWSAAIVRLGKDISVSELMTPTGFWSRSSDTAYTLSGSFMRWLLDTRGADRFRALYRSGDPVSTYGETWESLERRWRSFLASYPLSQEQLDAAAFRFDRPSIFEKRCARAIAGRFEEASEHLGKGSKVAAVGCLEQILADDPASLLYKYRVAGLMRRAGLQERAMVLAGEVAGDARATRAQRSEAARLAGDVAWERGDAEGASRRFTEALTLAGSGAARRALGVRIEAIGERAMRPQSEIAVRRYLAEEGRSVALSVAELLEAARGEASGVARYLAAVRLLQLDPSATTEKLADEALAAERDPARAAFLMRAKGRYLARKGDRAGACATWEEVAAVGPSGSEAKVEAVMWLGRCTAGTLPNLDVPPPEWE